MTYTEGDVRSFATNMRNLCECHDPLSQARRKMGINRQQFNKTFQAFTPPSPTNTCIISNFFGVNSHVLFSRPAEFGSLIDGNFFAALEVFKNSHILWKFIETGVIGARSDDAPYLGICDHFQYSLIYSGRILRSAFCIYQRGDFLHH